MPCFHQATVFQDACQYYCQWQYDSIKKNSWDVAHSKTSYIILPGFCLSASGVIPLRKKSILTRKIFYFLFSCVSETKAQARPSEIKQQCCRKSPDLLTPSWASSALGFCSLTLCACPPPDLLVLTWQIACFWQDLVPFFHPHRPFHQGKNLMTREACCWVDLSVWYLWDWGRTSIFQETA